METTKYKCFIREGLSKSNVPWAINIKWQVIAKFNALRLFHWNNATFEHNTQAHSCPVPFLQEFKNSLPADSDLAFATLQDQPFKFLFCGIGFSNPNTSPIYGPEVPSQTTETILVSDVRCVVLYYLAAGSNLMRDVEVSSCSQPHEVVAACPKRRSRCLICTEACIQRRWRSLHPRIRYCRGSWVFPPNSSLLCSRSEMVHPCINPVNTDQETRLCLLEITKDMKQKSWDVYFCALPSGISVHSVHILCGIPVLHGQWCRPI